MRVPAPSRRWWRRGPDARLALDRYARIAGAFDPSALEPLRHRAIARLGAGPGQTVLDVGCGTGASFAQIQAGIGPAGRLIGVDQSPEMLARARARVRDSGWENVTLVESPAATMPAVGPVDSVLIFYVHDVMRSPAALDRLVTQVRPGGRVVAAGPRWAPWWAFPLSLWIWHIARPYHTTFEGFRRPWSHLAARVARLDVERTVFGRAYFSYIAAAAVR
jgi:demethylmenaquinone methyltransferase/2-methoxy-6-polyprenyl-1,4-benzoquinol methylase